jgi:phosphatidylinositol 4-kinase
MIEQLASLLLPIDALLSHPDLHLGSSSGIVSLFRNMWFLCVLFHFTTDNKQETAMEWQQPALSRIAAKTPPMIYEEAHDSLASELEYSSVIRQEYAYTVRHSSLS